VLWRTNLASFLPSLSSASSFSKMPRATHIHTNMNTHTTHTYTHTHTHTHTHSSAYNEIRSAASGWCHEEQLIWPDLEWIRQVALRAGSELVQSWLRAGSELGQSWLRAGSEPATHTHRHRQTHTNHSSKISH